MIPLISHGRLARKLLVDEEIVGHHIAKPQIWGWRLKKKKDRNSKIEIQGCATLQPAAKKFSLKVYHLLERQDLMPYLNQAPRILFW